MKPLGYIVLSGDYEDPLELLKKLNDTWKDVPPGGILLRGCDKVTVFPSRQQAKAAAERTRAYFVKISNPGHDPRFENFSIRRLVPS